MIREVPGFHMMDPPERVDAKHIREEEHNVEEEKVPEVFEVADLESEDVPEGLREKATEIGIDLMKDVLKGVDDCVVFASTAMYLQGKKHNIEELQVLPGDFDGAVASIESLKIIRERLANVPGVVFDNDGKFKKLGEDEAMRLSGVVNMGVETEEGMQAVAYEFEFFQNSRIVTDEVRRHTDDVRGLNVLNFEGLRAGYLNNYEFEVRVGKSVREVAEFLVHENISERLRSELKEMQEKQQTGEPHDLSSLLKAATERFELSPDELEDFYHEVDELKESPGQPDNAVDLEKLTVSTAKILSGHKNKIEKRLKNLEELEEIINPEKEG